MKRRWPHLLMLSCGLAGCLRDDVPSGGPTPPAPSASSEPAPEAAPADGAPDHPMPGPYRRRLGAAVRLDATCVACHAEEADQCQILPGRPGRTLVRDDRVFADPVTVELSLDLPSPPPRSARASWWVSYQRVATVGTGTDPRDAKIESEVLLHSGALPWDD